MPDAGDERLVVAAFHRLGLLRTDQWPVAASYLLVAGGSGDSVAELAGLPRDASAWQVDRLVEDVPGEAELPALTLDDAAQVVARVYGQVPSHRDHAGLRTLASLAPGLDYPGGIIGEAWYLSEWLDCDCHEGSVEREQADLFERRLSDLSPPRIDHRLAMALLDEH
jgi:hypothetical protein